MRTLFTMLIASVLACATLQGSSQTASQITLKGRALNEKGATVDYATVLLTSAKDSAKVYGGVTDEKGTFAIKLPQGTYGLKISFMGYDNLERTLDLTDNTDLGDLTMTSSTTMLGEVVVTGNIITREADRFVVNLANTPLAIGRDGKEALALAPGVWMSEKGEISIYGRKGTQVMVNERLLRETGDDLLNYMQNLKAEDILKIEVIPYSGAEYDAATTAGIIKITLKKQRSDGMEGSVTMRYGSALANHMSWYLQPAVNLKYRSKKFSLYTDLSMNRYKAGNTNAEQSQFYTGDRASQKSYGEPYRIGTGKTLRLGGVYDIDDRQSVGVEVNLTDSPSTLNNRSDLTMTTGDNVTDVSSLFTTNDWNNRLSVSGNYILKLDTLGSTFKLFLDYNRRNGNDHSDFNSIYSGFIHKDTTYRSYIGTLNNIYSVTADFDIALSKRSKLTTGAKYTNNGMDNTTLYEYLKNDAWNEIGDLSSLNRYNENIGALYVKYSTRFKNNISLALGLRGEYTYAVPSTSSTVITDKQNYFGLFPNANLSIPLNKKQSQTLILGYSRKIQRPSFWALNPFRQPLSEYSYGEGNPKLKPSYRNDMNLTWVFARKYTLVVGAQFTKGMISQIAIPDPTQSNTVIYKYENIQDFNLYYANLSIPAQLFKWWQMTVNMTGMRMQSTLSGQATETQNSFQGNMNNTFTVHKNWYFDLTGNYNAPMIIGNIHIGRFYAVNAGIKHTFAKGRMTASLYMNDVFNSGKMRITSPDKTFTRTADMQSSFRRLGLSLRYNFKAGKSIKVKNVESGAGDEKSRLSGGSGGIGGN